MTETVRCPDCGAENSRDADTCASCGFPLKGVPEGAPAPPPAAAASPPILPPRPRRRPQRASTEALSLWLVFGTIMALVVIWVAIKANVDRAQPAVQGASADQQVRSDSLRQLLDRDSSNVEARVKLGDVLYDTANWGEAIVQYKAAIRRDSTLVNALVDLGVCYYNLGDGTEAEHHFLLALQRDPHQPIALFNLGIVHEARNDPAGALEYYHRALRSDPPPEMKQPLIEAMNRVQDKAKVKAPPLPGG
jgi:tetratricopeptide (TPR) repeat protein